MSATNQLPEPELGYIKTDKSNQPAFSARQMREAMKHAPQPAQATPSIPSDGPSTYEQRFTAAVAVICGVTPPAALVCDWINKAERHDDLQQWVGSYAPGWAQNIAVLDAAHQMADQPTEGGDHEPAQQATQAEAQQPATGEPVYWEWRHLSTHPDTVDFGKWSEWKRVEARSAIHTIEDALAEFRTYIAQGYKYELRALYTHPAPSVRADVVRGAGRYRFILAAADDMTTSRYKSLCELLGVAITEDFDLGAAIDAANPPFIIEGHQDIS